jgi:GNAT superfamily N-acetyltransferase
VSTVCIRPGTAADAPLVLALFDEAVAWLVARGQPGQWGATPWSERPSAIGHVKAWSHGPGLRIAEDPDGAPLGALVLGVHPPHVEPIGERERERYVEALVTSRRHAGRCIGALLVAATVDEARRAGATVLRVDCWAGAPPLVAWYERQGFVRSGTFDVDDWIGQVFTMRL